MDMPRWTNPLNRLRKVNQGPGTDYGGFGFPGKRLKEGQKDTHIEHDIRLWFV
jgi:hypothetical protein